MTGGLIAAVIVANVALVLVCVIFTRSQRTLVRALVARHGGDMAAMERSDHPSRHRRPALAPVRDIDEAGI